MLHIGTFQIRRLGKAIVLKLWPFTLADLDVWLGKLPLKQQAFVAVSHSGWPDGFHPPSPRVFGPGKSQREMISELPIHGENRIEFDDPAFADVIDLKFYFPAQRIKKKSEIRLLEDYFRELNEHSPLARWRGFWVHIHDACKVYITVPSSVAALNVVFRQVLTSVDLRLTRPQLKKLCDLLNSIPDNRCLLLAWTRGERARFRIANSDIHNYESVDDLLSRGWQRLED